MFIKEIKKRVLKFLHYIFVVNLFLHLCAFILLLLLIFMIYISGNDMREYVRKLIIIYLGYNILAVIIGHVSLYYIVDNADDKQLMGTISFILSRNHTLFTYLTLGIFNTYILDIYYISKEYPFFENGNGVDNMETIISWIPIINLYLYIKILRRLKMKGYTLSTKKVLTLYLEGRLAIYLIKNTNYKPSWDNE